MSKKNKKHRLHFKKKNLHLVIERKETPLVVDDKKVKLITFCGYKRIKGSWDQLWDWNTLEDVILK